MITQRKIDNALLKRFERKEPGNSRKVNSKEKRVYFLIVCEGGQTEPNYFKAFDKDDFPARNFNAAIKEAAANNIKCAWSNEAFELWYILHFQYMNSPFQEMITSGTSKQKLTGK